ncbi:MULTISPECIES: phosphonate C-P lyase system protein PhnG [Roseobacteraceae]|uniref:Phosphonate metabolism protein PhnG n=1 Tax=Celeribacter baekdonensis B30 TaxID=1208323 RepID=K2ICQ8_9RHOB|nr:MULTISPECIES: phosphonate C-P lyase system protein PhnG [Roseobacteraceae]EKE67701.1 phosphonate metabolism protein PhnG [Celeribacter baekdonensis B30]KAB6715618.1 phosphonate C-P lyase system protein PhnG [Roseobacter sp. TSBP12]|tara:strand:+ start:1550 stop:1969 length:420 start_codon:yes stop_codon:yes gene_type:complete
MTHPHNLCLTTLARSDACAIKTFGEELLDHLDPVEVLSSRTGLVMLPMRDTAQGTGFHLGEVLVSEAHIRMGAHEGYGMRRGRDLEAAMAMALVDLALDAGRAVADCTAFVSEQAKMQQAQDHDTLCRVEATRVDMETF